MFWMVVSLVRMDWKLVDWSACTMPIIAPVSCCGKKPFGTITKSATFKATVANRMTTTSSARSSDQASVGS